MENYIAIGDIHGRFDLMGLLMEKIAASDLLIEHKLVFLGDMIDRGPRSYSVVAWVKQLCEEGKAIAILGNHESMMLEYFDRKIPDRNDIWFYNGGRQTLDSYEKTTRLYGFGNAFAAMGMTGHIKWLKSLPYFYETDAVWFSHAPIPKEKYRKRIGHDFRADVEALTWSYHGNYNVSEEEFAFDHGKTAVCGHIHALREGILTPRAYPTAIYADTGSGCGVQGRLTAIIITDGQYSGFLQAAPEELGEDNENNLEV